MSNVIDAAVAALAEKLDGQDFDGDNSPQGCFGHSVFLGLRRPSTAATT